MASEDASNTVSMSKNFKLFMLQPVVGDHEAEEGGADGDEGGGGLGFFGGKAVEVGQEVHLGIPGSFPGLGLEAEVVDEDFGVDFFLDVERGSLHDQVRPVLLILPPPNQLRIQVPVPPFVSHFHRRLTLPAQN